MATLADHHGRKREGAQHNALQSTTKKLAQSNGNTSVSDCEERHVVGKP